jgi:hypothetical protein
MDFLSKSFEELAKSTPFAAFSLLALFIVCWTFRYYTKQLMRINDNLFKSIGINNTNNKKLNRKSKKKK